jgi:hypothetical protein
MNLKPNNMTQLTAAHKKTFSRKLLEFQKKGWQDYRKYIVQQQKIAEKRKYHEAYKKYLTQQLEYSDKKIKSISDKLN